MMVHAHHVLPVRRGGNDAPENLLLLCPIHHEYADFFAENQHQELFAKYGIFDAHDKTSLLITLKALDKNPERWWQNIKKILDAEQLKATESIAAILDNV